MSSAGMRPLWYVRQNSEYYVDEFALTHHLFVLADDDWRLQGSGGHLCYYTSGTTIVKKRLWGFRLRPLNEKELARNDVSDWECINDNTILFRNGNLPVPDRSMYPTAYAFDRVFRSESSTKQVYEEGAKEVALSVISGINSSIFAYGQTSSGKTYTMTGITEYTITDIYGYIQKHAEREFILKFSAMEIYNESVRDLLVADSIALRLLDDPERGTVVEKLTEETVRDWDHAMELLSICEAQRQIGETSLNETSSRSHQIIRLTIESSACEFLGKDNSKHPCSICEFCCHINRSLLTLGTVIRKLSKGRNGHVPFRDSKLTRILQSSLGGNGRTAIICTLSPARSHVEQSRNTLLFASCAKEVTTNAQVNVVMSDKALVKHLQRELARLESELRSPEPTFAASDSAALLRERDLKIEKLEKEIIDLTLQRDTAQSQVRDLLRLIGDDGDSMIWVGLNQYPHLQVRKSPESENTIPERSTLADPHSLDAHIRTYDTSQYSHGHSGSSSDDHYIRLPEFEENFLHNDTSPQLSVSTNFVRSDSGQGWEEIEEQTNRTSEDLCKEVRCIETEDSNTNRLLESNPLTFKEEVGISALRVIGGDRMDQELMPHPSKEDRELNCTHPPFVVLSPEKPSPWLLAEDMLSSGGLKLTKSRSCKASLMISLSSPRFDMVEKKENTPANEFEKDFIGRPEGFPRKLSALNYGADVERLSRKASQSSIGSAAVDKLEAQNEKTSSTDENCTSISMSVAVLEEKAEHQHEKQVADSPVHETELKDNIASKNVKDVGLDPIEDDSKILSDWPSEFKRLQREIIELWHACNVSLVHRTYFFVLFKGDPTDSIYMQVELRRLSFLKDTFCRGNQMVEDLWTLTPASSMKDLRREREMLSKEMRKRLSEHDRESLYLKWGIGLNSKNRRLQLTNRLWTSTEDMDHIEDSAFVVANLVGFMEPGKAPKEMFGLNFSPRTPRRRSYSLKRSVISLFAETLAEIEALTSFKVNLHDPLGVLNGWDSSSPSAPCDWRGVACYNGRVSELRLPRLQLAGPLTEQIANLRMLRKLSLRSNLFNGTIPRSLSKCTLLHSVFLQYNSFSGDLPPEIANLTNLQILNLAQNQLSGEVTGDLPRSLRYIDLSSNAFAGDIPKNFSYLSQLQLINLSYNQFSGEIPASFGELQQLQYLWLDYNLLEGTLPSAIANCSSLVHLSVEGNTIGGVIPSAIGALPKLQVISLSHNNLSGSVPSSMFCNVSVYPPSIRIVQLGFNEFTDIVAPETVTCFSILQVLDLQQSHIHGVFPSWLTNISTLTMLDVSGNSFSGAIPIGIGNLWRLEELKMANNSMNGIIPAEIKTCNSIRVLDLEGNHFAGEIPAFLSQLKGLKMLSLGGNQLSGSIPSSFGNLTELETLNLRGNSLTGPLPEELMGLSNLTTLNLSGNKFSGGVLKNVGNLRQLSVLNMSGNSLSGTIPASVGTLYKLTTLDLSKQNLSGELPFDLPGLPNLQVIALQENKFSGDVPEGFSSLLSLRYLNLSSNSFSGHIPSTFGFLRSLLVLSLSNNHISGSIPPELGNCSDLQILSLHSNSLNGEIPIDVSRLSHLNELDLGRNNLTGEIPESLSNLSNLTTLDLSANNLSGVIPANLTLISSLVNFNVSQNNLEGEIPVVLGSRFNNPLDFAGNPNLCGKPLDRKCKEISSGSRRKRLVLLIVVAAIGACLLPLCCCFYIFSLLKWRKRLKEAAAGEKKRSPARASTAASGGRGSGDNGPPKLVMFNDKITLAETIEATRQFDEENVLSRTRYGLVFKACYNDGMVLSIRRLPDGSLDENMFRKEAESLGKVKHRNLTVLRGYYAGAPDLRLLVYDYMPNGNLATLLQEAAHQDGHVLNWPMRHLIALGISRGLAFLHTASTVHGDIKPQNVLFDADFEAHLTDFGLERFTVATPTEPSTSTSVGTLGYISPEAAMTGEATKESDVYSFGIVLLELLTGKRPVMFTQDEDIVKWVKRQLQKGQISELLDPGLLELDPESSEWEEFLLGVKVGLLCTAPDPLDRPTMADIVFMLEGCRVGPDIPSSADPTAQHSPA
ncbi:hypothetical protein F0562_003675 [Nyssa sinensis]|uniref:Protein kinase domain-containing protein n=1 Tax=Nyssa sinensis TaxID=561372 RepID=A0A5J5C1V2_9ASTE|nr:hypothetical protein F0562_003675 [Nyssa sinensis]